MPGKRRFVVPPDEVEVLPDELVLADAPLDADDVLTAGETVAVRFTGDTVRVGTVEDAVEGVADLTEGAAAGAEAALTGFWATGAGALRG